MSEEQFAAEFECDPYAAIMGAYYGREMAEVEAQGRIRPDLPMLPGPIHCAWDLGNGANMAIWAFQVGERNLLIHDFIQMENQYFDDYLDEVERRGYRGYDYLPHDAKVPSFETGRTRIETVIAHKRKPVPVPDHHVEDGIHAVKMLFPRVLFNGTNCASGLEALRQYRQEYDEKTRVFKKTAKHDWSSHGADAFRYLAMAWKAIVKRPEPLPTGLYTPTEKLTIGEWASYSKGGAQPFDKVRPFPKVVMDVKGQKIEQMTAVRRPRPERQERV